MTLVSGCAGKQEAGPGAAGAGKVAGADKVKVVASFYPMYFFTSQVGGDRVEVATLVPGGVEPHDWEPRPADVKVLSGASLFVYNGIGMEPWAEKLVQSAGNADLLVLEASEGLELRRGEAHTHPDGEHAEDGDGHADGEGAKDGEHADGESAKDGEHANEHGEHADEGGFDPHVWLDPVLAQAQVKKIAAALAQVDPAGKATYETNAGALIARLQDLDQQFRSLAGCPGPKEIVISHAFMGYPAARYGLKQLPIIAALAPHAEPTPKQIAELVDLVRQHQVKAIFFETLVSDRVAQVLAQETGAQALALNPIEGLTSAEQAQGKTYLDLMQSNLDNLKIALGCGK
jgi:zinc transport system substrate-binding protein